MSAARTRLASLQTHLMRALVAQAPVPAGFDEARVRAAARSLVNKRRRALARSWPALGQILGDLLVEPFSRYAEGQPLPACGNPRADGRAFLDWLEKAGLLNDAGRLEALAFDLHFRITADGLRPRHGLVWKTTRLREKPARVIAVRVPWLGERWWRIPR